MHKVPPPSPRSGLVLLGTKPPSLYHPSPPPSSGNKMDLQAERPGLAGQGPSPGLPGLPLLPERPRCAAMAGANTSADAHASHLDPTRLYATLHSLVFDPLNTRLSSTSLPLIYRGNRALLLEHPPLCLHRARHRHRLQPRTPPPPAQPTEPRPPPLHRNLGGGARVHPSSPEPPSPRPRMVHVPL